MLARLALINVVVGALLHGCSGQNSRLATSDAAVDDASTRNDASVDALSGEASTTVVDATFESKPSGIPSAAEVHQTESLVLPPSVATAVIVIPNEAHEPAKGQLSDKNSHYLPKHLTIAHGTAVVIANADAPWDTPHWHATDFKDTAGTIVKTTALLKYTEVSEPVVLPPGSYTIADTYFTNMSGTVTVQSTPMQGNSLVGAFFTPTAQVDPLDNDGGSHPGWVGYYETAFPANGFAIESRFDFVHKPCDTCPGGYWPDNKTGSHSLLVFSTNQLPVDALAKFSQFIWENTYI